MAKDKKPQINNMVRAWLLHGATIPVEVERPQFMVFAKDGQLAFYRKLDNGLMAMMPRSELVATIAVVGSRLAELYGCHEMTQVQAANCMFMIESYLLETRPQQFIADHIKPVAFANDEGFCLVRLPVPRMEPHPCEIDAPRDWERLGDFLNSIRLGMKDAEDPEPVMFKTLMSAVGALLWDDSPRREILYWHGKGGEGKTTFCNFLVHKLGPCALPNVKPKRLTDDYTIAQLEGVRLVVAEEAGKGRFLTEEIKAITGNRYLFGRAPYAKPRPFRNHTFFWMTSNQMPHVDGESASAERLRLVCSTPRKDGVKRTEENIFAELEERWPDIVEMAILEYFSSGQKIHEMAHQEMTEIVDEYHLGVDGWIMESFEYCEGAFTANQLINRMKTRNKELLSRDEIYERMKILTPALCDASKVVAKSKRRAEGYANPVWGFDNVRPKSSAEGYSRTGWLTLGRDSFLE